MTKRYIYAGMSAAGFDEVVVTNGWILGYLTDNRDKDIYQKDIEHAFGLARSTVANIMKLLEKSGYVVRSSDGRDARLKKVTVTDEGVRVHMETVQLIDSLHEEMEKDVTPEERECFLRVLDKMTDNMKKKAGGDLLEGPCGCSGEKAAGGCCSKEADKN